MRQGLPVARGKLFMAVVPVDEAEAAKVSCDGVCKSEEGRSSGGVTWWNDVLPQLLSQRHLRANAAPKIAKLGPGDTPRSPATGRSYTLGPTLISAARTQSTRPEHTPSAEEGFEDLAAALMMGSKFHRMTFLLGGNPEMRRGYPREFRRFMGSAKKD